MVNVSVPYVCVLATSYDQTLTQGGINGRALPCVRLACVTLGDCVTNEPHIFPALRAECKTARAGSDKSIG